MHLPLRNIPRVLIIAGSDSGGGAGIQGDIKTLSAQGVYAATAITALTAQNTLGVQAVVAVPEDFVAKQIESVLSDMGADVIKTGMLHREEVIAAVVRMHEKYPLPLVVDPVMIAKGGAALLEEDAQKYLREQLLPRATVITPNIPEAEALTGQKITSLETMEKAGRILLEMGAKAALIKGGHGEGETLTDVLISNHGVEYFHQPRQHTSHTHGTGCAMASFIAGALAQGLSLSDAVKYAQAYVAEAIRTAPRLGAGHGPLNHGYCLLGA
jgi:hydroxymethylpyrimidine/phosphomethylpyrimidine kinase